MLYFATITSNNVRIPRIRRIPRSLRDNPHDGLHDGLHGNLHGSLRGNLHDSLHGNLRVSNHSHDDVRSDRRSHCSSDGSWARSPDLQSDPRLEV